MYMREVLTESKEGNICHVMVDMEEEEGRGLMMKMKM